MLGGASRENQREPRRRLFRRSVFACALLFAALGPSLATAVQQSLAQAQTPTTEAMKSARQTEFDALYELLLLNPSDRDINRRLIDIALELGDYDAAIGAVERLIYYEPENVELQLEAGRLYYEIKSYVVARSYLEAALAIPSASPAQQKEATNLLGQITEDERPSPWGFFGQVGARYQTNANIGPAFLDPNTEPWPVEEPAPDWNAFGLGTLVYSDGDENFRMEATLSTYYADQVEIDRLDLGFAELVIGPRFINDSGSLSFRPYGIGQGFLLGSDPYQTAYGGGATARLTIDDGWWFEPQVEYKRRDFYISDDYPDATLQTGDFYTVAVNGAGQFSEDFRWRSRVAYYDNVVHEPFIDVNGDPAESTYYGYTQYYASLSVRIGFEMFDMPGWALQPFASASLTNYKGIAPPEVFSAFDTIREDFQWNAGATLEIPVYENFGLNIQVQYTDNDSNLSRYRYENLQIMSGPTVQF
jgi:tetratricopeptide (TPR) repeat protein